MGKSKLNELKSHLFNAEQEKDELSKSVSSFNPHAREGATKKQKCALYKQSK